MRLLLDSQLLIWLLVAPKRIASEVLELIQEPRNEANFSVASIWEIAIKSAARRSDFAVDPHVLRGTLLDDGYRELVVSGQHAAAVADLPVLHKDPFDRLLLAQARLEGMILLTTNAMMARYPVQVRQVQRAGK